MRKTMLYVAVLAILGFGVWYFLFSGPNRAFSNSEAGFNIHDTGSIGKIFLADNNGHKVTLTRTDSGWQVNGYKALESQIKYLLMTLALQQPERPVPENSHNDVVRTMAGNSIKTELYDRDGKLIRSFYVGHEVQSFTGTYMLIEGAKQPFVVNIPGFDGYLQPRYNPDILVWRDRTVFNIPAEEINSVSVQYAFQPLNSYAIHRSGDNVSVKLDPQMQMEDKPVNKNKTLAYFTFFTRIFSEGIVNGMPHLDSVIGSVPRMATVEVTGKNNYHQLADLYYFPMNRRSKNAEAPITDTASYYDSDHYYAVINNKRDTVSIQVNSIEKIFRLGYQFFTADEQPAVKREVTDK